MKTKIAGVTDGLFCFLVSLFLFFWLGSQLFTAMTKLKIPNLRTVDTVAFEVSPLWFAFVLTIKALFWLFSIIVIYEYIRSKIIK